MKKVLAVDGNSIVNRAFYGVRPLSNKEGFPTNALFGMISILEKNLETVKFPKSRFGFSGRAIPVSMSDLFFCDFQGDFYGKLLFGMYGTY